MSIAYRTVDVAGRAITIQIYQDSPRLWLVLGYIDEKPFLARANGKRAALKQWREQVEAALSGEAV